jgi:hypothetical protein
MEPRCIALWTSVQIIPNVIDSNPAVFTDFLRIWHDISIIYTAEKMDEFMLNQSVANVSLIYDGTHRR